MRPTPRLAITAVFAAFGVIGGLWSGSVPSVAKRVGLDEYQLGLAFTVFLLAIVLAMTAAGYLARHVSSRRVLLVTVPAMAILGVAMLASTSVAMFVPALIAFGVAQGLTDVFMNAEGSSIETELGRPVFTGLHAAVSVSVAIFAIAGSLLAAGVGPAASAPIVLMAGLGATWLVAKAIGDRQISAPASASARVAAAGPSAWWPLAMLGLAVGFDNAGEMAALLWSARLLDEAAPSLAVIAGIGPAFYAACNALVRLNGDRIRARIGDRPLVIVSLLVATAGFIGVGLFSGFAARVAAFAVVGFGTACVIPCMFAIAANSDPEARARRLGFVSMIAGPPRVLTPFLFGAIAQRASMGEAFGLCSALMIGALVLFLLSAARMQAPVPIAA